MKIDKYLKNIEKYSQTEISLYNDIISIKHYREIAEASFDITDYGIDYISLGFFSIQDTPIFISNMPEWAIAYHREGLWKLDSLNTSKNFYLLGESHLISDILPKSSSQMNLYNLCSKFDIYEAFSLLRSIGKYDIIIIAHTKHKLIEPVNFFFTKEYNVLKFTGLFIERIISILKKVCPCLKNDPIIKNSSLLNIALNKKLPYKLLNSKEEDTIKQASLGLTAKEISSNLGVSVKSINKSLKKVRDKLSCSNTFQAVSKAKAFGILDKLTCEIELTTPEKILLTDREIETIYWTSYGYQAKEIAKRMYIDFKSVQKLLAGAQQKLNCKNKVELVFKAHILGLLKCQIIRRI